MYSPDLLPSHNQTLNLSSGVDLSRVITVTGVMGVGKGYVLRALQAMPEYPTNVNVVSFGDILAAQTGVPRDQLRHLSQPEISELQNKAVGAIKQRTPLVLDSHVVPVQNGLVVHNPQIEKLMRPAHYVALITDPETIKDRRINDSTRTRVEQNAEEINMHQKLLLAILGVLSHEIGSGLTVLRNDTGETVESLNMLLQIMREENVW